MIRRISAITLILLVTADGPAGEPRYGRDIRPILSDRCFKCHGPDAATRFANLRLDERDAAIALRDGSPAIVPGRVEESELWRRITSDDPAIMMPPPDSNKRALTDDEREQLKKWIAAGASYEPHWAFVPPMRPATPKVADAAWCSNPIDNFILARLEAEGITPAPPADLQTLVRRVTLDLTGLPPTVADLRAIAAEGGAAAYTVWIDKLLTLEPGVSRYAERMATPWLDAARYADTSGIHMDAGRQMWAYRDWVLRAYRANMPFDRFITEQLAGDLLPDATLAQKVASGFNRCHVTTDEGGAIAEEYLVEYAVDRASTTGSVFLGLTVGCARCHDHKFDPISQAEFFSLYAYFNSIEEPGLYSQLPDANRAFEPFIQVPTPDDERRLAAIKTEIASAQQALAETTPDDEARWQAFQAELPSRSGLAWRESSVIDARSIAGATLSLQPDGSVLASGANPDRDDHVITLRTTATDLRLIALEALTDASFVNGRVGRADNGNAVLTGVRIEAVSIADPSERVEVPLMWAWADFEQANGDFRVVNILKSDDDLGWAVDAHNRAGPRTAMLLAETPFGFDGGTDVRITLQYQSIYSKHTFGRVRIGLGSIGNTGVELLPAAVSGWYTVGPFQLEATKEPFEQNFEPESDTRLDLTRNFGAGNQTWRFVESYADDRAIALPDGRNVTFVARRIFSPTARNIEVSLGSDDGFALLLNGEMVASRQIERGVAPNQDKATLPLRAGANTLVFKIINTGGQAGYYYRAIQQADELSGSLGAALLPAAARWPELLSRVKLEWKLTFSPGYRQKRDALAGLEKQLADANAAIPLTMIMKELPTPRETFVLSRGLYDKPDKARPVSRGIPAALGTLPVGAPADRLGLAQWLTSAENPLVARVAVNRLWEMFFGTGLVATSEDFGMQGEWPSHPELLDWLAVEFRESGWNVHHMIRLITSSATYRQDSRIRPDIHERDPDNRGLAYFPRRRLPAETIRDQALFVSGLLVEKLGGPSVRPYQPEGLWQEISMPQSNTRVYQADRGEGLWRRSLYTYWKRACPPPSLMTLDAPTRESCVVKRVTTNTPLQALALWNDEQFVEASRKLAERAIAAAKSDKQRLEWLFETCVGRAPAAEESAAFSAALGSFRLRYASAHEDAVQLLKVGVAEVSPNIAPEELAAWTLVASAALNLSATVVQR